MLLSSSLGVGGFGVDLGDNDVLFVDEVVGEGFPNGSEGLAVCIISLAIQFIIKYITLLTSAPRSSEGNENVLVTANGLCKGLVGEHVNLAGQLKLLLGLDAGLVSDEVAQAGEVASRVVFRRLVALSIEELERGEALDAKSLSEVAFGIGIDLGDLDLVFGMLESTSKFLVDGSQGLAVSAPGGEELDKSGLARLENDIVEVARDQVNDSRLGGSRSCQGSEEKSLDQDHCE